MDIQDWLTFEIDPEYLSLLVKDRSLLQMYPTVENLSEILKTSPASGLSGSSYVIESHQYRFGTNSIKSKISHGFCYYFYRAFHDEMLIFLIIAAVITFITEMIQNPADMGLEGISILVAVLIIVSVTASNDYKKEKQFFNLHTIIKSSNKCSVIRDGNIIEIPTTELVVGDLYLPNYGDSIPADCIVFVDRSLQVDESSITGESQLVTKTFDSDPYLLSGTKIMDGCGKALVVAVGMHSQAGRIVNLLTNKDSMHDPERLDKNQIQGKESNDSTEDKSILQEKLSKLAKRIGYFGLSAGIIVFIVLLIRFCTYHYVGPHARGFEWRDLKVMVEYLVTGISIVVVAIPEGLPLAVTISLAFSVSRMLKDHNLVRHLHSCETMGNATTICSDKTGTLTTNRMSVIECFCFGIQIRRMGRILDFPKTFINSLCMNICFNKSPTSRIKNCDESDFPQQIGNKTDCALLSFLKDLNTSYEDWNKIIHESQIITTFPFNSSKKIITTIVKLNDNLYRILVKGAPEGLIKKCCDEISIVDEKPIKMAHSTVTNIIKNIKEMNQRSLRTILLACKDIKVIGDVKNINEDDLIQDLTFLMLVGIDDPVRSDVPSAIKACQKAGVIVRMVTGDNLDTAISIALQCGILEADQTDSLVLDSENFNKLIHNKEGQFCQNRFDQIWPKLKVLARSTPYDKYVLVDGIINTKLEDKQIVAVTGDGTNDAPALKRSDVGFAMGKTGTDISKDACDIILTDDNFASIVKALLWGRNVYDSILKFIQFQLTVNFTAIVCSIITSILYGQNVFKPTQLLWVNIIMDSFASLALSTDSPTEELLNRKPYPRNKSLISTSIIIFILFHSIYQISVIMFLVFVAPSIFTIDNDFKLDQFKELNGLQKVDTLHSTFIFNAFIFMQVFNQINARKLHSESNMFTGISKNKIFISVTSITVITQILMIEFTFNFFHVVPLTMELWLWSIFIGLSECVYHQLIVINARKYLTIPKSLRNINSILENNGYIFVKNTKNIESTE